MNKRENTPEFMYAHVSVDCAVFGFDDNELKVLLVEKEISPGLKLPGSLIYQQEDTDSAAARVLYELTGIRKMALKQFKCFSAPERTQNPEDMAWLEQAYGHRVDRLITVAYLSLCKINRALNVIPANKFARWCPVNKIPGMPFDHNRIVEESLGEIRRWVEFEPAIVFELLPAKFTMSELRQLYEAIYRKGFDVRNFNKKIAKMGYVIPLEEKQKNVPHRAARYYKFDKIAYNKLRKTIE